jgi:F-type H+-transporting ATPase subunit a
MKLKSIYKGLILSVFALFFTGFVLAESNSDHSEGKAFDPVSHAMHHVKDAHEVHLTDDWVLSLPVILWTDNGLVTFMSSEFHHTDDGSFIFVKDGVKYVKSHEKIYILNKGETHAVLNHETHVVENGVKPYDFSISKNVATMFLVAVIMLWMFLRMSRQYKGGTVGAPKGIASWMEPLVLFVRDDIAKQNIGKGYQKFMPYLLTVFFFIWFGNMLGLIPFLASPNMTGNISMTLLLATLTLVVQLIYSKGAFWKHIFMPPGVPAALWIILVPIEFAGIFIKPAALMIRLFANITAGHVIVVSLISIIFINKSAGWAGLSVPMALFISILEILVAFLQAYIFTMLSALFIGSATAEAHDH